MKSYSFDKLPETGDVEVDGDIRTEYPSGLARFIKDALWDNLFVCPVANSIMIVALVLGVLLLVFGQDTARFIEVVIIVGAVKGYYVFQFDKNSVDVDGILTGNRNTCDTQLSLHTKGEGTGIHIALKKKDVTFTVATSFISYEQALRNLQHDSTYGSFEELKEENEYNEANAIEFKQTLTEIKEIARVNSINTCWTAINLCADCDENQECGLQSPFEKLKAIIQIISEVEDA